MSKSSSAAGRFDPHQVLTDRILEAIEIGVQTCVMPWHQGPGVGRPVNAFTGVRYRGVNVVALWAEAVLGGYGSGVWASYRQWARLGAQVRRGAKGATIVFYKPAEAREDEAASEERPAGARLIARASRVFNADQVAGWRPEATPEASVLDLAEAEAFVAGTGAAVRHGGTIACYRPREDVIEMPDKSRFLDTETRTATEAYYGVLLHELTHWSGATHRLGRAFGERFGDEAYAVEELVAELGAAFLCADLAITNAPRPDHAAYVAQWLKVLHDDRRAIFLAARLASQAVDYLRSLSEPPR